MPNNSAYRYAGMATQWLITLGIGIFLGIRCDRWLKIRFPVCTILFPLLAMFFSFWKLFRELNEKNDEK